MRTRRADNTFTEKSPYTVTYENYEVTDGVQRKNVIEICPSQGTSKTYVIVNCGILTQEENDPYLTIG